MTVNKLPVLSLVFLLAAVTGCPEQLPVMQQWYNGYRFSRDPIKVYNPYSVLHALRAKKFSNYWLETGTPAFLIKALKNNYQDINNLETLFLTSAHLGYFESEELPLESLLYQTGYLTIVHSDQEEDLYRLGYPNPEVEVSFKKYILAALMHCEIKTV